MAKRGRKPLVIDAAWQEDLNGWMTVPQAANYKGCTAKAIHKKIDRGTITPRRLGTTILVSRSDIDAWNLNEKMQAAQKENWRARKRLIEKLDQSQDAVGQRIERWMGLPGDQLQEEERAVVVSGGRGRRSPFD